jgi:hypothetical protein
MASDITITQGTVGRLGDTKVGVTSIWEDAYKLPDGSEKRGITAQLSINDQLSVVGAGSVVKVGDASFSVVEVKEGRGEGRGTIVFRSPSE